MQVLRCEFESGHDRVDGPSFIYMCNTFPPFQDAEAILEELGNSSVIFPFLLIRYYTIDHFRDLLVPEPVQTTRPLI